MQSIKENWNQMARAYDAFVSQEESFSNAIELPAILSQLSDLEGKDVFEFACGSGRLSFEMEKLSPNKILAVDVSQAMIELAEAYKNEKTSNVSFFCGDFSRIFFPEKEQFDVIVASTVFHFIEDLDSVIEQLKALLKPKGKMVLSLIHPVHSAKYPTEQMEGAFPSKEDYKLKYLCKEKRAYVQPWISQNKDIEDFLCYSYHHTLEDYFRAFHKNGLSLINLLEPLPPKGWKETKPAQYHAYMNAPNYLVVTLETN